MNSKKQQYVIGTWTNRGAGCCSDRSEHFLFKGYIYGNLDSCKKKCLGYGKRCQFIEYGWKNSNWCSIISSDASCQTLKQGRNDCGSGDNTGVHAYEYKQGIPIALNGFVNGKYL